MTRNTRSAAEGKLDNALAKKFAKRLNVFGLTKPKSVSQPVKTAINRAISLNTETKCAVREVFKQIAVPGSGLNTAANFGLSTDNSITRTLPDISGNTGNSGRSGCIIKPKRLMCHYSLRARDISGTLNQPFKTPFYVRIVAYNHRYAMDDYTQLNIINKGNQGGNLDSSPDSFLEPYNKRNYKIYYSKTIKMTPYFDRSNGDGTASITNQPNGFVAFKMGKFKIKTPKSLVYSSDTSTYPQNFMPHIAFAVCNVDGIQVPSTQFRVDCNLETRLYYTDA